jgi:hypothetical protein
MYNFWGDTLSIHNSDWGEFGSYVGGFAGAFLTLLSIILIIKTLDSQNRNAAISQFEASFFELFRLHKEITDRIEGEVNIEVRNTVYVDRGTYKGLKFFEKISEKIELHFDNNYKNFHKAEIAKAMDISLEQSPQEMQSEIEEMYNEFYRGKESDLGHYFRSLYHLVKFVSDSEISCKQKYIDLIQAYLTDAELHCTFYNGIAIYGRNKFKPLLDEYSFLENINPKGDIFERHFKAFYPNTYTNYLKKPRPD